MKSPPVTLLRSFRFKPTSAALCEMSSELLESSHKSKLIPGFIPACFISFQLYLFYISVVLTVGQEAQRIRLL